MVDVLQRMQYSQHLYFPIFLFLEKKTLNKLNKKKIHFLPFYISFYKILTFPMDPTLLNIILNDDDDAIIQNMAMINEYIMMDDAEESTVKPSRKRRIEIFRNREQGDEQLTKDYFLEEGSTYTDEHFRRRFRMTRELFNRIKDSVVGHDSYFVQKRDAARRLGLSPTQKISAAIRLLAYGIPADLVGEMFSMGESTTLETLKRFCTAMIEVFGEEYLRAPNSDDMTRLLKEGEARGFPGMIGSLDCMHWEWKNCPTALHGLYQGKEKKPTIILEAVASYDLWIWHAFFGLPGSLNDINVLGRSNLFSGIYNQTSPEVSFTVNKNQYNMGYYLTDGIYPSYATFVKSFSHPSSKQEKVCIQ